MIIYFFKFEKIREGLRTFTLSNLINQEKIAAKMDQGVLRLTLPKAEKMKPKKITVSAG
jgi:HSP20 family molecular chaperone IbpA